MKCWLGLHSPETVTLVEYRSPLGVVFVDVVRCARCGVRIMETIRGLGA